MNSEKKKVLHATFRSSGVEIDLDRFFYTPEGIEAWNNDLRLVNQLTPDFVLERERIKQLPRSERSWDPRHPNFDPSMIPNFHPEMIETVFNVVEIMEEENAPFFVRWYRKARRALDKLMCKP